MQITCINSDYYKTNIPFKNEQKESSRTIFTNPDYVSIPREKYERDRKWSLALTFILGIDLAFNLYRYFKK